MKPHHRPWTQEEIAEGIRLRNVEKLTFREISRRIGRNSSGSTVHKKLVACGAQRTIRGIAPVPTKPLNKVAASASRCPLDAGDPVSWGAITAGTLLEGLPYPGNRRSDVLIMVGGD